jgi:hypothetical protein
MDGLRKQRLIGMPFPLQYLIRRIVPILGTIPIGIGMIGFFLPSFIYVIEAFGFYAASAIAALYFLVSQLLF